MPLTPENRSAFAEIQCRSIDEQAKYFMLAFADEFQGKAEIILDKVEAFKAFLQHDSDVSLGEVEAHRMLEAQDRPETFVKLRELLREIDTDNNGKISLIEWLLFDFGKTVSCRI